MATKAFKKNDPVEWKWLGRTVRGKIVEIHHGPVTKTMKGKSIRRIGTRERPAYLVESQTGNLALKLKSELVAAAPKGKPGPRLFS